MYIMIKPNIGQLCGLVEIIVGEWIGNPNSLVGYWLKYLSGHPALYKSLVMSRLDYASQLWSPYLLKHVYLIEKVQGAFNKHNT